MSEPDAFQDLIRRARLGEEAAARALVGHFEPHIHRAVRAQLLGARLGRTLEAADISQAVLARFFVRLAKGQYELEGPEDLVKLLNVMARNQVLDQIRKQRTGRRDSSRLVGDGATELLDAVADPGGTPSRIVAGHELIRELRVRLSADERHLADQRALGRPWADIAADQGANADALRKKLDRALTRVLHDLGLDDAPSR